MKTVSGKEKRPTKISKAGILFTVALMCVAALIIICKYASFMVGNEARKNRSVQVSNYASEHRGNIRDRNGSLLATQTTYTDIVYKVQSENNRREYKNAAEVLGAVLNRSPEEIMNDLLSGGKYRFYKRRATSNEIEMLRKKLDEVNAESKRQNEILRQSPAVENPEFYPLLRLSQFIEENQGRSYPKGELASHILGFVDFDGNAKEGIERICDADLSANKIIDGVIINRDVYLTIDTQIQYMAAKQTKRAIEEQKADAAIFIVMDARTGEILAMENKPNFDPNHYNLSDPSSRMNRAVAYAYEPGSVFKIFTCACAYDTGRIDLNRPLYCRAAYRIPGSGNPPTVIKCVIPHGEVFPKDAIVLSCNTAACTATECLTNNELYTKLRNFGFGQKTGLGLNNENKGVLRRASSWSGRSLATVTMGQEISATALQIVTAATVFANEGRLLKPHIIKSVKDSEGNEIYSAKVSISEEVLSYTTVRNLLEMMTEGTDHGLARKTSINGISLASKTGTAQIFDAENKRYYDDKYVASVLTLFPAEKPRFIIYGAVFAPKANSIYGSQVTAPLVKDLAEDLILYLNVYKETDMLFEAGSTLKVRQEQAITISDNKVPDLIGRSKRDLIGLYSKNFKLRIEGDGKVVFQSPQAGTELTEGAVIYVRLR